VGYDEALLSFQVLNVLLILIGSGHHYFHGSAIFSETFQKPSTEIILSPLYLQLLPQFSYIDNDRQFLQRQFHDVLGPAPVSG
jgi:hypothetical protein